MFFAQYLLYALIGQEVFHVKRFGTMDGLRKRTFGEGGKYEHGIWRKPKNAIDFMLGEYSCEVVHS